MVFNMKKDDSSSQDETASTCYKTNFHLQFYQILIMANKTQKFIQRFYLRSLRSRSQLLY